MATTTRQTSLFGVDDWKKLYKTYQQADFQSYNFETLRKTMVDYIRQHHPESFNDFTESSEFVALLDVIAFVGQSLAFRSDMNTRENFLDTAERRDSVNRLAALVGYAPKRNVAASGFLKVNSVSTTENLYDYNRNNLSGKRITWNDKTNPDWQEQMNVVFNAAIVNNQKIGNPGNSASIVGVRTDEYQINIPTGFLPVAPFTAEVNGSTIGFEVVSGTSANKSYIYEPPPIPNNPLNLLYRDDTMGFSSANTGYFFYFKQGSLVTDSFSLTDRIANRSVDVDYSGINSTDFWLFKDNGDTVEQWVEVESIYSSTNNQTPADERNFFSITSRSDDRLTLNFGDGVFSKTPIGNFDYYARRSNGLRYTINPTDMRNVLVAFNYVSKSGKTETITFTVSLTTTINNSLERENIDDIKRRAPARYYSQNRMVNGEDYTNLPYALYSSIIKSKAINRSSVGVSRYLEIVDPTARYSSVNAFGADGLLYKNYSQPSFRLHYADKNELTAAIQNRVEPFIGQRDLMHFYYDKFTRYNYTNLSWHRSTTTTNSTTGYFYNTSDESQTPVATKEFSTWLGRTYIDEKCLLKFEAPTGYVFNDYNKLIPGTVGKTIVWARIERENYESGEYGNDVFGQGRVVLNNYVDSGAKMVQMIRPFSSDLDYDLEVSVIDAISSRYNFGLGFDHLNSEWYLINHNNINLSGDFSLIRSTNNTNSDSSWLVKFEASDVDTSYTVTARALEYFFGSISDTRFYYDSNSKIYDPKLGRTVNDFVSVLKTSTGLGQDIKIDIIDQTVEADGFVNDFNVKVSYTDIDSDGVLDDPDFFTNIVSDSSELVFLQRVTDFDNLSRYIPVEYGTINSEYATEDGINDVLFEVEVGQVFYATGENKYFEVEADLNTRFLTERDDFASYVGKGSLHYQYRHNSPENRRVNPGTTNIIDMYVVTQAYYDLYRKYIQDMTGTLSEPGVPSTDDLSVQFSELQDYKMASDNIVLSSVKFKPLFGDKADSKLQAYIKVTKLTNVVISDSEIRSRVIAAINTYFDINYWDFGDTFYFSELSSYLHSELGDIIGSAVIIPKDKTMKFGTLYEIKSAPNEIFVSAATVNDVEIIDALSAANLNMGL